MVRFEEPETRSHGYSMDETTPGLAVVNEVPDIPDKSEFEQKHTVTGLETDRTLTGSNPGALTADQLAIMMERACLHCAVDSNEGGDNVWLEDGGVCAVGFGLKMKYLKPIPTGTQLTVTATKSANVSREVTFDVKVQDANYPDCLYAEATHLRAYVPWDHMHMKVDEKNTVRRQLAVGLKGVSSNVVETRHTGGPNDVADPDGPVADCAGTGPLLKFMERAVHTAVQGFLPPNHVLLSGQYNITHLAPTPCGFVITTEAELVEIREQTLTFSVIASDPFEKVATASMEMQLTHSDAHFQQVGVWSATDQEYSAMRPAASTTNLSTLP